MLSEQGYFAHSLSSDLNNSTESLKEKIDKETGKNNNKKLTFGSSPKAAKCCSERMALASLMMSLHFLGVSSTLPARKRQAAPMIWFKQLSNGRGVINPVRTITFHCVEHFLCKSAAQHNVCAQCMSQSFQCQMGQSMGLGQKTGNVQVTHMYVWAFLLPTEDQLTFWWFLMEWTYILLCPTTIIPVSLGNL